MNMLKGLRGYIGLSLVWAAILGGALFMTRRPAAEPIEILPPPTVAPTAVPTPSPTLTPAPLRVDVAGAVNSPGVYTLPRGSVVSDAIVAAAGPADDADLDRINKAMPLQDGAQVYVPHIAKPLPTLVNPSPPPSPTPAQPGQAPAPGQGKLVNINTATLDELDTLPGIGPATAQRIVDGRPYATLEDLMKAKGIGQATFDKLKTLITVR